MQVEGEEGAEGGHTSQFVDAADAQGHEAAVASTERITTKFMTKYERARILGVRALQIAYVFVFLE